jgi:hypothetical protein
MTPELITDVGAALDGAGDRLGRAAAVLRRAFAV